MTASVLAAHREAAAKAGMDGFASKPVDWHALSHEIAKVLALPPVASAPPPSEAPRHRVLNQKAGLQRWADNEAAYHQALHRFVADYSTPPPRWPSCWPTAARRGWRRRRPGATRCAAWPPTSGWNN
jgi:hypothetical protein